MKTIKNFLSTLLLCLPLLLCSCELQSNTKNEDNRLINLATLAEEFSGKSRVEIETIIQKRGFVPFNETNMEAGTNMYGSIYFAKGIQLDNTMDKETVINHIRQQKTNATILCLHWSIMKGEFSHRELDCYYIVPENITELYSELSKSLYHFYSTNFPFESYAENPSMVVQYHAWRGEIADRSYSNNDERYAFLLSKHAITQQQYEEYIQLLGGEKRLNRAAFVDCLNTANREIVEDFQGVSGKGNMYSSWTGLWVSDQNSLGITEVPIVKGKWSRISPFIN